MGYNKNGISESLLKKLSSAKNTAQSSIKTKKYDTSNISASLAQKLGLESADARVSVSNSGGAAVNLKSPENVAKTKKFLKENPTYMYDGKSLVKNPQAEKAIKDLKDYKNAVRIMGKNVTNFAGGNTLDDAYNIAKDKKQKAIDTQLKLENDYKHITTYEQAKKEAEKATDETTKNYLLNKAQGLKTRSDYESEIADLENQIAEVNKRYAEYEKYPVKDPKLYENTNKHIEDLTKRLTKVKDSYEKNKSDLSKRELTDFLNKNPKVHSTFELLYNIEKSKKQNTANADEAVHDKVEVSELYTDKDSTNAQNALKELEKKHGKNTIDNYYKWFERVKEEEKNSYNLEIAKKRAELNPVLTSIESVTTGLVGSVFDNAQQAGVYFGKNFFGGDGYYDPNSSNSKYVDTIRDTVASGIEDDTLRWFYNTGMNLADSGISMALNFVPFIGPALSAGSNYSRAQAHGFNDAYERTGNVQNAFYSGIAQGVAELVFEKVSLDQLIDIKNVGVSSFKDLGLNIAKSAFVEGSEETFTEIANTVTNQIINKDLSNINLSFKNYIAQGYSEEKAWEKVKEDYVMQLGQAFLGGALGGTVFGGGVGAYSYVNNRENTKVLNTSSKEMGQAVIDSGMDAVEEVISNGLKSKNGKVNKLANKLNQINKSGKKVDASDIGNLLKLQETDSVNVEEVVNAGLQEKVDTPAYNLAVTLKEQLNKGETIAINHIRALERELGLKKVSQATDDGAVEYKKGDVKVTISSTLHPNGLYAQTKKGKKVIIAQVESADSKNNSAKILTTDGAVFDIDDLTITDPNYKALLVMTPNLDTNGAKALVANYEKAIAEVGEISGSEYAEHFYNLYEASKDGITFEQAKNVPNLQISINHIGTYTSVLAMSSAQNDINPLTKHWKNSVELVKEVAVNDNAVKLKSGHIYADENVDVKNADISKQLAILDGLAKKANIDIVLSSTLSDYENGRYEDGRIIINANKPAEYIASVVMHEVGHDIKTNNPDAFETLTDFVLDYLKAKNVDIEKRLTEIKRQYKRVFNPDTAREMATEELVCNTLMSIPSEQEAMNVLSEMDIKEKRSLLRALKDFIERIKNYLKKHGLIETKAFTDDFEAINKLANMVNESIVRERSSLETSKHSFEEMDNKYIVDDTIKSVRNMNEKELDSIYMLAVESGETEIAQYLVDEVARRAGYEYKGFHSSRNKFTSFNKGERAGLYGKGIYFSPYPQSFYGKETYSVYLKIKNPMTKENEPEGAREVLGRSNIKGSIIPDFYDLYPQFDGIIGKDEMTVKNPEQIKSADPVTYDNNGNVIPLSERFKDSNKDIRYSLTEPGEINDVDLIDLFEDSEEAFDYDFTGSNLDFSQDTKEAIQNTNKILADMNRLTKGKKISDEALLKICKKKIKEYSSKQDADILCRDMQIILNALEQSKEQDDFNTVFFEMIGLCKNVLDKSMIKVDHFKEERENVKAFLKDYGRIRVDSEQVAETASAFDGWNNYRKQMFGFANLIKSDNPNSFGRPTIDIVWGELCELCPGLCDPDVNPLEAPMALLNLKEKLKPTYEHLYLNMDEQALEMAQELLAEIYNAKYENDINAKLDKANADFTKKREKQQKKQEEIYKKRYNKQVTKLKEQSALADKLKGREEQIKLQRKTIVVDDGKITRIYEVNAKNAIKVMALHDKKIATEAREEIRKMLTKVARWGVNPNKNAYMPAEFANAFRDLLKVFTVKPKGEAVPKIYEPLNRLRTQYIELGKNRPENYNDLFKENGIENLPTVLSYSKEIREKLDELCEKFKKADIYHISGKELREIASTLKSIINSIENSRTMIVEGKTFEITKFAMGCINELQSTTSKVDNILMEKLHNYELEILSPQRVFRHWGNYDENSNIYKLGEMLNQGQRKAMDYRRDFTIIFNESIANNKKYFKTITGSTAEIIDTGMIINGKKIEITKGMALSLYLNCRNSDNMYHIIHGGVTFPNAKLYKKGKVKESYSRQNATPLTFTDIKKICSIVENDPILMEFAKLVNTLFEKQAVEINKTSVLLFGYEAATIENYFPIISDENFLNKDIDALIFDSTLAGNGSLKHRVRSKNPILLTDVFDVVMKHIDWASDFCGLAIPISNFMKVYNTTIKDDNSVFSFKEELERVWGLKAKSYLENLITKLQTNRNHHNITDRFRGNFAQAVLTMNPRTGLINLSAYPVASSIIGHKPLRQAMKKGFKRAPLELINKYTSIMWYRTQGEKQIHLLSKIRGAFDKNYEPLKNQTELGNVLQKKKLFKRLFDNMQWLTHWIQKADSAVVGRLWFACEYYVNDNYADLEKGTDDYYMQVAEIFIKVVEETQQNYTVMQSPVILNNTDTIFKEAFLMFKSQSLQEFGLIFEATGNLRAKAKAYNENKTATNKEALKQAKQQYARTISGRVVSTVLYVALGFVATFALNKTDRLRDENGEITLMSLGSAFANEFFANLAGLFIGGDELYNFIYALIARENYYPVGLSSVEYLFKIPKDAYNLYISLTDEERDIEKIVKSIKNFVFDGSVVTGLPTKNLWDIVSAIYSHGQNIINGTMLSPDYAKMANSQKAIAMYNALIKGDREKYAKIYNTFIAQGKEDKDIQQYLKTVLSSRNSLVTDGAKAYINNNYDVYENSITELEEIGFSTKTIKSAIELKVKELGGDKEEAPTETKTYTVDEIFSNNKEAVYDKDMLWEELIEGNDDNFDMIYSELLESGLTEKQIEQSINSRKRSLIDKYLEAVENSENINAAEYYEQLVNAYGSDSKADKAIEKEEKKDKEKD